VALTHLIVAYSNFSATILPLWMAKQTGLFEAHGLEVDLQYVASATSGPAVISGQMQLATVGLSEVLGAMAGGADLVVVATQVPAYTYIFAEQFADTAAILGKTNDALAKLDVSPLLDTSFIRSAEQRGVGAPE